MTLVRIMRRALHRSGVRKNTPQDRLGDAWIVTFTRIFGERPNGNNDPRWDILISNGYGCLHGLRVMRRAHHSL